MKRSLGWMFVILAGGIGGSSALGDSPEAEVAARGWAITEAVMGRHVDPPTRQQMLLAGIRGWLGENRGAMDNPVDVSASQVAPRMNDRLALRASNLANADQLAALLGELTARSPIKDPEARAEAFFAGLLSTIPPPAFLLSPKERTVTESFEANLYVGIQVALGLDEKAKKPSLQQILEGGPAELAGLQAGDLLEEVGGVSVEGMPLAKVIDRLRGAEGTEVLIKASRPSSGQVFTRSLTRSRLPHPSIEGAKQGPGKRWKYQLDDNPAIGYVRIKEITGSTPRELRAIAETLESEGAKALILDLRAIRTAGFHSTTLLADALLDGGTIGRVASPDGERVIKAEPDALFRGWPMAVMTDATSAGEVAWLASALEDNKRATIVGPNLVANDPLIREIVPIGGGEWSVQMATGRLEKGDGQPLASSKIPFGPNSRLNNQFDGRFAETLDSLEAAQGVRYKALAEISNARKLMLAEEKNLTPRVVEKLNEQLDAASATLKTMKSQVYQRTPPARRSQPPDQSPEAQLAKAREILEVILKAAGK